MFCLEMPEIDAVATMMPGNSNYEITAKITYGKDCIHIAVNDPIKSSWKG